MGIGLLILVNPMCTFTKYKRNPAFKRIQTTMDEIFEFVLK